MEKHEKKRGKILFLENNHLHVNEQLLSYLGNSFSGFKQEPTTKGSSRNGSKNHKESSSASQLLRPSESWNPPLH